MMAGLVGDIRFALRTMLKRPAFTATAVLVLALGIGANAAVFSMVNALLLRPLTGPGDGRLVGLYNRHTKKADTYRRFSYANYADIRDTARLFSNVAAFDLALAGVSEGDTTRRAFVCLVSSNYFETLGATPARGRGFTRDEERPGRPIPLTVVSHEYWRRTGADPDLVGKPIRVSGRPFTVVGIAPPGLIGTAVGVAPEFWMPFSAAEFLKNDFMRGDEGKQPGARDAHDLFLIGRIKPGFDLVMANRDLDAVARHLVELDPTENRDFGVVAHPLRRVGIDSRPGDDGPIVSLSTVLMALSSVVLLVACLNLANMLLARGAARRKEIAIRLSIGASRGALIRQLLTEGFLLSLGGGVGGLLLARIAAAALVRSVAPLLPVPVSLDVAPDWRVLSATLGFAAAATLGFALWPALRVTRPNVVEELKEHGTGDAGRRRARFGTRHLLLASQVALSLALLATGALFVRGAVKASGATPGFPVAPGLIVEVDPSLSAFSREQSAAAHRDLVACLRTMAGVDAVSFASIVPFGPVNESEGVERCDAGNVSGAPATGVGATYTVIGADYFRALGLRPRRGREFTTGEAEGPLPHRVAIIDEPLARRLFPAAGDDPVGQCVQIRGSAPDRRPKPLLVVGVVPGLRNQLFDRAPTPHIYVPYSLRPRTWMNYHLRLTPGGPGEAAMAGQVRRRIRAFDERLPILMAKPLGTFIDDSVFLWLFRSAARVFTALGAAALALALVGVYGVHAHLVARRTREIGIRIALGATARDVLGLVLRETVAVIAVGVALGLLMAAGIGRGLQAMLYEVTALDPVALTAAPVLLAGSALAASYLPARRATRVTPVEALRHE